MVSGDWIFASCVALAFVLALAVGSHVPRGQRRADDDPVPSGAWWRSGIWIATFLIGVILSIALIGLTVSLTRQVIQGGAGLSASPPSTAESAPASTSADGNAIPNTMAAVAAAIAVVTLVLTVGTSWFATQQRELDTKTREVERQLEKARRRDEIEQLRNQVAFQGFLAKRAAVTWIHRMGTRPDLLALRVQNVCLDLDQLALDSYVARRAAFETLCQLFDPTEWSAEIAVIAAYTDECHRYISALQRCKRDHVNFVEEVDDERKGLACRIFDRAEVDRVMGRS